MNGCYVALVSDTLEPDTKRNKSQYEKESINLIGVFSTMEDAENGCIRAHYKNKDANEIINDKKMRKEALRGEMASILEPTHEQGWLYKIVKVEIGQIYKNKEIFSVIL